MSKLEISKDLEDLYPVNLAARANKKKHWDYACIFITFLLLIYGFFRVYSRLNSGLIEDYYAFYYAAKAILQGTYLYESGTGAYIYPPFFAVLTSPIAFLSYQTGNTVWVIIDALLMIIAIPLCVRSFAISFNLKLDGWQIYKLSLIALILTFDQLLTVLLKGQSDSYVIFGLVLGLCFLDKRPFLAGMTWGIIGLIKYQPLLFLPLLLLRKRWQESAGLLFGALVATFLPAIVLGWHRNLEYLAIAFKGLLTMGRLEQRENSPLHIAARVPKLAWRANISITSALGRFCEQHHLSKLFILIPLAIIIGIVLYLAWRIYRKHGVPFIKGTPQHLFKIEWCAFLMGILIFSPQCLKRHTVILVFVYALSAIILMYPLEKKYKRWPFLVSLTVAQVGYIICWCFNKGWYNDWGMTTWLLLPFMLFFIDSAFSNFQNVKSHVVKT